MPDSINNIVRDRARMFYSRASLQECIDGYFNYIKGEYEMVQAPAKGKGTDIIEEKVWLRPEEPPTISGLAFYLGFASREAFDRYEAGGRYGRVLKRGRLRIEAEYEKKLHTTSSTGAIFALKSFGWNERTDTLPIFNGHIKIEIINSAIAPAATEAEVIM